MIGVGLHIENEESKFGQEGLLDHEEIWQPLLGEGKFPAKVAYKMHTMLGSMPGACAWVLFGHWLGASLKDYSLSSKAKVNKKEEREAVKYQFLLCCLKMPF